MLLQLLYIFLILQVGLLSKSLPCSSLPSYLSRSFPQVLNVHTSLLIGQAIVHKSLMFILAFFRDRKRKKFQIADFDAQKLYGFPSIWLNTSNYCVLRCIWKVLSVWQVFQRFWKLWMEFFKSLLKMPRLFGNIPRYPESFLEGP